MDRLQLLLVLDDYISCVLKEVAVCWGGLQSIAKVLQTHGRKCIKQLHFGSRAIAWIGTRAMCDLAIGALCDWAIRDIV